MCEPKGKHWDEVQAHLDAATNAACELEEALEESMGISIFEAQERWRSLGVEFSKQTLRWVEEHREADRKKEEERLREKQRKMIKEGWDGAVEAVRKYAQDAVEKGIPVPEEVTISIDDDENEAEGSCEEGLEERRDRIEERWQDLRASFSQNARLRHLVLERPPDRVVIEWTGDGYFVQEWE